MQTEVSHTTGQKSLTLGIRASREKAIYTRQNLHTFSLPRFSAASIAAHRSSLSASSAASFLFSSSRNKDICQTSIRYHVVPFCIVQIKKNFITESPKQSLADSFLLLLHYLLVRNIFPYFNKFPILSKFNIQTDRKDRS